MAVRSVLRGCQYLRLQRRSPEIQWVMFLVGTAYEQAALALFTQLSLQLPKYI